MQASNQHIPLIECVLNVSEGRSLATLDMMSECIISTDKITLLHKDVGIDANRTVFSFAGPPNHVLDCVDKLYEIALSQIDMQKHKGAHPRVGALDVIPFVPLKNISKEELRCMVISHATTWSQKYNVPICWYGYMSSTNSQNTLSYLRKGGYENLQNRIDDDDIIVDVGPPQIHPSLGLSCVTIRDFMIAYNINLDSKSISMAKEIAKTLRSKRQKLNRIKDVKFLGWYMDEYNCCQISTNIYDIDAITMIELYKLVTEVAAKFGISTRGSELIGLAPLRAFSRESDNIETCMKALRLDSVRPFQEGQQILEKALGVSFTF